MLSRRTKARIGWALSIVFTVLFLTMHAIGRRYAAAVAAGDRPSREELVDRIERDCGDDCHSVQQQTDGCPVEGQQSGDRSDSEVAVESDATPPMRQLFAASCAESYGDDRLLPRQIAVGYVRGVLSLVIWDYDVLEVRSNRYRRFLYMFARTVVRRQFFETDSEKAFNQLIGTFLANSSYRTVFGVLRDPLGDD